MRQALPLVMLVLQAERLGQQGGEGQRNRHARVPPVGRQHERRVAPLRLLAGQRAGAAGGWVARGLFQWVQGRQRHGCSGPGAGAGRCRRLGSRRQAGSGLHMDRAVQIVLPNHAGQLLPYRQAQAQRRRGRHAACVGGCIAACRHAVFAGARGLHAQAPPAGSGGGRGSWSCLNLEAQPAGRLGRSCRQHQVCTLQALEACGPATQGREGLGSFGAAWASA